MGQSPYILMACKSEDDNRKAAQCRDRASPVNNANWASVRHGITLNKVVNDQDDQVGHGYQGCNTGVLEGVQSAQVGKRNHNQPANPKMLVRR